MSKDIPKIKAICSKCGKLSTISYLDELDTCKQCGRPSRLHIIWVLYTEIDPNMNPEKLLFTRGMMDDSNLGEDDSYDW